MKCLWFVNCIEYYTHATPLIRLASAGNRLKWKEQDHHGLLAVHFVRLLHNTLFLLFFWGGEGRERGLSGVGLFSILVLNTLS